MNLMKKCNKLVFSITLILTLIIFSGIAFAHIDTNIKWGVSVPGSVAYHSKYIGNDATNRIKEAANDWNSKVSGLQFIYLDGGSHYHKSGSTSPGAVGETHVTYGQLYPNIIDGVYTLYSTSVSWYYGTGSPSSSQYDFLSVVKHEFGHWYVLDDCYNSNHSSSLMYWDISPGEKRRTISSHDYLPAQSMY